LKKRRVEKGANILREKRNIGEVYVCNNRHNVGYDVERMQMISDQ